jgi:dTDP-4-dehydrorhamnose 3,5-epimerase
MEFEKTKFKDLFIIKPKVLGDCRGWFMRTFSADLFKKEITNFNSSWIQMNHSFNEKKGTWRGLHIQNTPFQEAKLVRCISGSVMDYAVDLRKGSETFLKVFTVELSQKNKTLLYIPKGFAHGFLTLEDNSELIYMHDENYHHEYELGIRYNDPLINININPIIISARDQNHTFLSNNFKGI